MLDVDDRDVALTGEYQGRRRMTLTYPPIDRARRILWLVTGEDKVDALARLRAGDESIPAGRIATDERARRRRRGCGRIRAMSERKYPVEPRAPAVLTVDVGGSHVKAVLNGVDERRRFVSGHELTAEQMVAGVLEQTADWEYVGVSVGVPGARGRREGRPRAGQPRRRAGSGFDFETAFGKPTKVINDAAMQALGSYEGGRMLFLGLGTGPRHDADHRRRRRADGARAPAVPEGDVRGLRRRGGARARRPQALAEARRRDDRGTMSAAFSPDYVVLGGGNARELDELPENCRLGHNEDAFLGGFRLWVED